jgi:hypothetical protein
MLTQNRHPLQNNTRRAERSWWHGNWRQLTVNPWRQGSTNSCKDAAPPIAHWQGSGGGLSHARGQIRLIDIANHADVDTQFLELSDKISPATARSDDAGTNAIVGADDRIFEGAAVRRKLRRFMAMSLPEPRRVSARQNRHPGQTAARRATPILGV